MQMAKEENLSVVLSSYKALNNNNDYISNSDNFVSDITKAFKLHLRTIVWQFPPRLKHPILWGSSLKQKVNKSK